jgi:uncharacterized protein YjdB
MSKKVIRILLIIPFLTLAGCDIMATLLHGEKPEDTFVAVTGVTLNKQNTTIAVDKSETLSAVITPANATNKLIRCETSVPAIATVTNGAVIGVSAGIAVITVTTIDGEKTDTCTVTVSAGDVAVTGVSLNKTSTTIPVGGIETLSVIFTPVNATNQNVIWESSAPAIVEVINGVISGKALGNAIITVTTVDGNKKASCAVTVSSAPVNIPVTSVVLDKNILNLDAGSKETLNAIISPSNATNKAVTWNSNAPSIATVSTNGLVTGIAAGNATITVTTVDGNKTATCSVSVSSNAPLTPAGLAAYLATLPSNTVSKPYNIKLIVSNAEEFSIINTALQQGESNKYVYLDLMGSTISSIPDNAFSVISGLGNPLVGITIPDGVTSIGRSAFHYCGKLASVIIPNSVTSIGDSAFNQCSSLVSITIPSSVTKIGSFAFRDCYSLTSITFQGTIPSSGVGPSNPFYGDLWDKFYAINPINGTPGTYTRGSGMYDITWTLQS